MRLTSCLLVMGLLLAACGDDENLSSEEDARRAYLGLEKMIDKAMDLGFQGFNAASSANIPDQTTSGDIAGTLVVGGKVDQGSSNNKGMRLTLALTDYTDVNSAKEAFTYNTGSTKPALEMNLKKIPDGDMTGFLKGGFTMTGVLEGDVALDLTITSKLEPDPADGTKVHRKPGTISVSGTATSAYGTYQVNLSL